MSALHERPSDGQAGARKRPRRPRRAPQAPLQAPLQARAIGTVPSLHSAPSVPSVPVAQKPVSSTPQVRAINTLGGGEESRPFEAMQGHLDPQLLSSLQAMNYTHMSPVQERVLLDLPDLRSDCLVRAKTGTGKTIAFLLPALHSILKDSRPVPRGSVAVLIVSPTRELALQIAKECDQLTQKFKVPLECHTAYGGSGRAANMNKFLRGDPKILVATPGRLNDYFTEPPVAAKFANIRTLILDEADTMLESGFLPAVKDILASLPPKSNGWQGMCFSATVPPKIKDVINCVLAPHYKEISTIDDNEPPTLERVPQTYVQISAPEYTFTTLLSLLTRELDQGSKKIIVFGVTARMVQLYADVFAKGLLRGTIFEIHSRLTQTARMRATEGFKQAQSGIMFASDVVGRGMDFPNVDCVVQAGMPDSVETYIHRVGRTARAGKEGRAVLILSQFEMSFIARNKKIPISADPQSSTIVEGAAAKEGDVLRAMSKVDDVVKSRAYSACLGYYKAVRMLGLRGEQVVQLANKLAIQGMGFSQPPAMDRKTIGKMGLKGTPGIVYLDTRVGGQKSKGGRQ